jgi:uncharacterized protein YjbI with pentapeptide repeats
MVVRFHLPGANGHGGDNRLELLTAGRRDEKSDYVERVSRFDVDKFYSEKDGGIFVEQIRREWTDAYDFVLVNCRSGLTRHGSICTIQLPDILVLLLPNDEPGFEASLEVARHVTKVRYGLPIDRLTLLTIPVLSRIPSELERSSPQEYDQCLDRSNTNLKEFYEDWVPKESLTRKLLKSLIIPLESQLGLKKALLFKHVPDPTKLEIAVENLTALLANQLRAVELLITHRSSYVRKGIKTPTYDDKKIWHVEWVKTGGQSGLQADFSGEDLYSATFAGAELSKAIFVGAGLRSANFHRAHINEANFTKADLVNADLKNVQGREAILTEAVMNNAQLDDAELQKANFKGAKLLHASFAKADLQGADLEGAILDNADLRDALLYKATFKKASLMDVKGLTAGQLRGVDLGDASFGKNSGLLETQVSEVRYLTRVAQSILGLLFIACAYTSYVVLFQLEDFFLFSNGSLGAWGAGLTARAFLLIAPVVLIVLNFCFFAFVKYLWKRVVELPAIFPNGKTLRETLSQNFTATIGYPNFSDRSVTLPKRVRQCLSYLVRFLVPVCQLLFWLRVLPLRDRNLIAFEFSLTMASIGLALFYQFRGSRILRTNNTGDHWTEEERQRIESYTRKAA